MKHQFQIFALSAALVAGSALPGHADQAQGFVESINVAEHSIVIMDPATGAEKTVIVHANIIPTLKKNSVVKATFATGSSTADTLEVLETK